MSIEYPTRGEYRLPPPIPSLMTSAFLSGGPRGQYVGYSEVYTFRYNRHTYRSSNGPQIITSPLPFATCR